MKPSVDNTVVLATRNAAKLRELGRILGAGDHGGAQIELAGLDEFPGAPDVPETGATFEANALLKARAIADYTGLPAVADDSGLCVDALNGMPGVLSARWAGGHGDDRANLELVLAQVADVPDSHLGAQFVCAAALVVPSGRRPGVGGDRAGRGPPGPGPARQRGVRLRPDLPARRVRPDHRRDDRRSQGRDQPSRPRFPRADPVHHLRGGSVGIMTDKRLAPGDPAPDFTLLDADGKEVSLSSFRGQQVIVYFYPAAMTPGCTKQACDFRDNLADLNSAGITVLGISPDQPAKLAKFRDKESLTFPLLSDPDHAVLEAYGAYGEKKLYGKTTVGVIRSTFVVDADGKISKAMYGVKATGHVARLRTEVGA